MENIGWFSEEDEEGYIKYAPSWIQVDNFKTSVESNKRILTVYYIRGDSLFIIIYIFPHYYESIGNNDIKVPIDVWNKKEVVIKVMGLPGPNETFYLEDCVYGNTKIFLWSDSKGDLEISYDGIY